MKSLIRFWLWHEINFWTNDRLWFHVSLNIYDNVLLCIMISSRFVLIFILDSMLSINNDLFLLILQLAISGSEKRPKHLAAAVLWTPTTSDPYSNPSSNTLFCFQFPISFCFLSVCLFLSLSLSLKWIDFISLYAREKWMINTIRVIW